MDAEKSARLEAVLSRLHGRWGVSAVRLLNTTEPTAAITTGFPALDALLAPDGIPRGAVTELLGVPTSGMTTLAYALLHQAQGAHAYAFYIDLAGTFDPPYAAACGIALDRLILARPETDYQALDMAHDLLASGRELALALDLGAPLPDASRLRRIHTALATSGCVALLLVTLHHTRSIPMHSPARLRLLIERTGWLRTGSDITGYRAQVTLIKSRQTSGASVMLDIPIAEVAHS